jgi:hypothetical protein
MLNQQKSAIAWWMALGDKAKELTKWGLKGVRCGIG